mgnify:FL=1
MLRVILDTNILISALLWSRRVNKAVISPLDEKKIEIFFSKETLDELLRALLYEKFAAKFTSLSTTPNSLVNEIITRENVFVVNNPLPKDRRPILKKDPTDDKFLYLAEFVKAEYIVSGDKVVLEHKKYRGIRIVSVDEFVTVLQGRALSM